MRILSLLHPLLGAGTCAAARASLRRRPRPWAFRVVGLARLDWVMTALVTEQKFPGIVAAVRQNGRLGAPEGVRQPRGRHPADAMEKTDLLGDSTS